VYSLLGFSTPQVSGQVYLRVYVRGNYTDTNRHTGSPAFLFNVLPTYSWQTQNNGSIVTNTSTVPSSPLLSKYERGAPGYDIATYAETVPTGKQFIFRAKMSKYQQYSLASSCKSGCAGRLGCDPKINNSAIAPALLTWHIRLPARSAGISIHWLLGKFTCGLCAGLLYRFRRQYPADYAGASLHRQRGTLIYAI